MKSPMEHASEFFSRAVGSSIALLAAAVLVVAWFATLEMPSDKHEWNEFIYHLTVIIAFIRIFFLERARYKEMQATQVKLDELIGSVEGASNRLIGAEKAPQEVLEKVIDGYEELKQKAHTDSAVSIEQHQTASQLPPAPSAIDARPGRTK